MVTTTIRQREITINGRRHATGAQTLAELLVAEGYGDSKVATAINGDFVAERRRADVRLTDGDCVEIVSVRQGG